MKKPNIMNVPNPIGLWEIYTKMRDPLFQPKVNGGSATYAKTEYR